jgi:hypothetical protein
MVRSHHVSFGGDELAFHLPRTLHFFHSYRFNECSSFSATAFGFRFHLDLRSDLLIFIYQGVFLTLDHVDFPQKSWI